MMGAITREGVMERAEWWRLLASPMMHGSSVHYYANIVTLVLVGILVERSVGRGWYVLTFFAGMIGSSIGSLFWIDPQTASVGASGAVFAVGVMGFAVHHPVMAQKRWSWTRFLYIILVLQPIGAMGAGVDIGGHIGGAIAGFAFYFLAMAKNWDAQAQRFGRRKLAWSVVAVTSLVFFFVFGVMIGAFKDRLLDAAAEQGKPHLLPRQVMADPDSAFRLGKVAAELFPEDPVARWLNFERLAKRRSDRDEALAEVPAVLAAFARHGNRRQETAIRGTMAVTIAIRLRDPELARRVATPACGRAAKATTRAALDKMGLCR
jgi:membrane associated rhomboid family serine protease